MEKYAPFFALLDAAEAGNLPATQDLIEQGADPNGRRNIGMFPLYLAAKMGHVSVVEALLAAGADVHRHNTDLLHAPTALHIATFNNHFDVVRSLIAVGAEVNGPDGNGICAVFIAAGRGFLSIVNFLLDVAGSDGDLRKQLASGASTGPFFCIRFPLHGASEYGHLKVVRVLIAAGVDVCHAEDPAAAEFGGSFPLLTASKHGFADVVRELLDGGAKVDQTNTIGYSALHVAAQHRQHGAVRALLAAGANVHLVTGPPKYYSDPMYSDPKCALSPLYLAVENVRGGVVDIARDLLNSGAEVHASDETCSPLLLAATKGHLATLRLFLAEHGADCRMRRRNGTTLADVARGWERTAAAEWLEMVRDFSPLQLACEACDAAKVRSLLRDDATRVLSHGAGKKALAIAERRRAEGHGAEVLALVKAALRPWRPAGHHVWPASFRTGVRAVLMAGQWLARQHPPSLPVDVWLYVLSFCHRGWFAGGEESDDDEDTLSEEDDDYDDDDDDDSSSSDDESGNSDDDDETAAARMGRAAARCLVQ